MRVQVWYDDEETLGTKYAAAKAAGVRVLGMWTADCAGDTDGKPEAMWAAVPPPRTQAAATAGAAAAPAPQTDRAAA